MKKIFVLDTSVMVFDHECISQFHEHDVVIPIAVLEELDNFKNGSDSRNFNARECVRKIDKISDNHKLDDWIPIGKGKGNLKIYNDTGKKPYPNAASVFGINKNDHRILNTVILLANEVPKSTVILIAKDINLRIKGKSLGIQTEDYFSIQVKNPELISKNTLEVSNLSSDILSSIFQNKAIPEDGILGATKEENGYYTLNNCKSAAHVKYDSTTNQLVKVDKKYAYGVNPKNTEQIFALDALLSDNIKIVALQGVAGTGKTLLALAAALEQIKKFDQIILSRPIVPLGNKDIGYLPGDAEDKIAPYMMPLWDNLKFIKSLNRENSRKSTNIEKLKNDGKIEVTALTYIRGRSIANAFFIIDEAQNLTPHEVKTIVSRAGEGTKLIFTGDIHQIDSPYLDEKSNGLSYIIDRLRGQKIFSYIHLEKGERSELSDLANKLL